MPARRIHQFANGVRVYDDQLLPVQRARYQRSNVHEEQEEAIFLALLRSLPAGAVFVNVGTAIGYYVLLAKLRRPDLKIYCFEPLPRHIAFFSENIPLNGLKPQDFSIFEQAVALRDGCVHLSEHDYSSRVAEGSSMPGAGKGVLMVRSVTLPQICRDVGRAIDLLQMDIQGIEHLVLQDYARKTSASSSPVVTFLVGTHGPEIHDQCKAALSALRYGITCDEPSPAGQPDGILVATLLPP